MKKQFRTAMLSTVCLLVVGIMSLTGVTYAWFTAGNYASVSGMEVQVDAATGGIWISTAKGTGYSQNLTLTSTDLNVNDAVSPVSTVGNNSDSWVFYTATANDAGQINATTASEGDYIKVTLFLKNDGNADITVNLGSGDQLTAIANKGTKGVDGYKAGRLGMQYVATYDLSDDGTVSDETSTSKTGSVCGTATYGIFSSDSTDSTYKGLTAGTDGAYAAATGTDVTVVAATDFDIKIPARSVIEVDVYAWMEGQDSDCKNTNAEAQFKIDIYFVKE